MASIRLTEKQEARIRAAVTRRGVTRSEWIRRAIETQLETESRASPHELYLEISGPGGLPASGRGNLSRAHSALLKEKLRAKRRRR